MSWRSGAAASSAAASLLVGSFLNDPSIAGLLLLIRFQSLSQQYSLTFEALVIGLQRPVRIDTQGKETQAKQVIS